MKLVIDPVIADSARRLTQVDVLNDRHRVSLPISLPSGGYVDVSVYLEPGGTFTVSDDGCALFSLAGYTVRSSSFASVAREKSANVGVDFDGNSIKLFRVSAPQLSAAIALIGNTSAEAAHEVVARTMRAQRDKAKDKLFETIDRAFAGRQISHDVGIFGASTAEYRFDAVVKLDRRNIAFDIFTKDPVSIAATYTKLSDVSRSEDAPALVGATANIDAIGPKLMLVSSVAKIIKLDAEAETLIRVAEAA